MESQEITSAVKERNKLEPLDIVRLLLHAIRILIVLSLFALTLIHVITNTAVPNLFLIISITISIFSLINLVACVIDKNRFWIIYTLLLFVAMVFGTIGDFLLGDVILFPTSIRILNGVLSFGTGHIFYTLAILSLSPIVANLISNKSVEGIEIDWKIILRNLVIWILLIACVLILFVFTVFNPGDLVMSVGVLVYGILLISVFAYAVTKIFDRDLPLGLPVALIIGFFLFFFSDWIIGVHEIGNNPQFLPGALYVHITYIPAQFLIQITGIFGTKPLLKDS